MSFVVACAFSGLLAGLSPGPAAGPVASSTAVTASSSVAASPAAAGGTHTGVLIVPPVLLPSTAEPLSAAAVDDIAAALTAGIASGIASGGATAVPLFFATPTPTTRPLPPDLVALQTRAQAALDDLDTKQAVTLLRQLVTTLEGRVVELGEVGPLVDARLALGGAYLAAGEPLLARAVLDAAARLRPALDLDLRRYSPIVVEAFDASKGRVAREPPATVELAVSPDGADVVIDGVPQGASPGAVRLPQGEHLVWIGAPGHVAVSRVLVVEPGSRIRVTDPLVEEPCFTAARALAAARDAGRDEELRRARALATCLGHAAVVVSAIVPLPGATGSGPGGAALLAARVDADSARAGMVSLPPNAATGASAAALAAFGGALATGPGDVLEPVRVADAPDGQALLRPDWTTHLTGVGARPVVQAPAGPVEEPGLLASPWLWIGAGGVAAALAGGVVAVVLLQPAEVTTGPPHTRVLVEVVP